MFILIQKLLPKHFISRLVGILADSENVFLKTVFINLFDLFYRIDTSEAVRKNKNDYRNFNDFFTRSLEEGARPIRGRISSPADGRVADLGRINENTLIQSKKYKYKVQELLAEETDEFNQGSFLSIYLAPHNYHRVHVPRAAELSRASYLPGELFSVNSETAGALPDLFTRNERLVCRFITDGGPMAEILVGAMLVAGIKPVWLDSPYKPKLEVSTNLNRRFQQGDELGQFQMGSTVILVFSEPLDFLVQQGEEIKVDQAITK